MIDWISIHKKISRADKILLSTHENPDGDGLGCAAAMYHYFKSSGKETRIIQVSDLPEEYEFLEKGDMFETYQPDLHDEWLQQVDLALIFDVGDFRRLRIIGASLDRFHVPIVNIDHHPDMGDQRFSYNLIDVNAAATGEMLFEYFHTVGVKPTKDMCEGIYTAVMTDTGSFRYNNTNVNCHEIAIACLKAGVNTSKVYQHVYETRSRSRVRLLGKILDNLHFDKSGELAWFIIDRALLSEVGASREDVNGFTDFVRTIRGVEVALMLFENGPDSCRINLRSKGKYTINETAKAFGGGGHKFAAGAVINGKLNDVLPGVLDQIKDSMARQNGQLK
ncbi:MAG: bifunctional oligoribonuclease/PAP phosphatase NrnA [Fidelibacterota bacterium]